MVHENGIYVHRVYQIEGENTCIIEAANPEDRHSAFEIPFPRIDVEREAVVSDIEPAAGLRIRCFLEPVRG